MNRAPAVSVIIPTHRDRGYINETIESVRRNIVEGDEIIVVFNGHDDSYLNQLKQRFGHAVRVLESPMPCVARARNLGAKSAKHEFVLLVDDDDMLQDGGLADLRRALGDSPDWVAAVGNVERYKEGSETSWWRHPAGQGPYSALNVTAACITSPGAGLMRRDALLKCGGFNPHFVPTEDFDLWLKLARRGTIFWIDTPTLRYRVHEGAVSRQSSRMALSAIKVFGEHRSWIRTNESARSLYWALMNHSRLYSTKLNQCLVQSIKTVAVQEFFRILKVYAQFAYHVGTLSATATVEHYFSRAVHRISPKPATPPRRPN